MELLAPAGNLQKLKSAVLYGADAVYLAGPRFGLRGASDNFSDHELQQSVKFAHSRNCKVYVTLNAFLMAFSGNCTISNYTAGRDSNRGGCIQSCRFSYQIQPDAQDSVPQQISSFMSSKDLNGLRLLPNFVEAGIDSIKIEGRMKSTLYAATTVSVYSRGLRFLESEKPGVWEQTFNELAPELEKIPHRDYTEASLENAAEEQSIFYGNRDGRSQSGYEMAGRVLEVSGDKHFILEVQNPFQSGHELEVLEFSGSPVGVPVNKIKNLSGEELQQALPNRLVLLPFQQGIEAMNVVRRKTA